jgi:hypothetical protein
LKEKCGETGIRTLDTLWGYTHFPGVLLKPLGHLSFYYKVEWGHKEINKKQALQALQETKVSIRLRAIEIKVVLSFPAQTHPTRALI